MSVSYVFKDWAELETHFTDKATTARKRARQATVRDRGAHLAEAATIEGMLHTLKNAYVGGPDETHKVWKS